MAIRSVFDAAGKLVLPQSPFVILILCALGIFSIYKVLRLGSRDPRLPPGPPTVPVLGNAHLISASGLFKQFLGWAEQYGTVFSLKLGSQTMIVLADRKAVHRLLIERGARHSSRPQFHTASLISKNSDVSNHDDDKEWRDKRKFISHYLSPKQLDEKHYKVQEAEATVLMNQLLDEPDTFYHNTKRYTLSVISSLTMGQRAATWDSWWCSTAYKLFEELAVITQPGRYPPVDQFPFLKLVPPSIAKWTREPYEYGLKLDQYWRDALNIVRERRKDGTRRNCVADMLLDEWDKTGCPISEHSTELLFAEFVTAGADTTASQLLTLILAFAKYPQYADKARKEIDALCGTTRAPVFDDFKQLPYVNCLVKEGMRWRPVAPTALPHYSKEDDEYEGMFIPKGSIIFIAVWAMHHMESNYKQHDEFNPDRYLNHPKLANDYAGSPDFENRDHMGYGAGRRICPGIHLAERNMWRIAAKLLWAFDFAEPVDASTGKVAPLDIDGYADGTLRMPLPFKVRITPRSQTHINLIKSEKGRALHFLRQYD